MSGTERCCAGALFAFLAVLIELDGRDRWMRQRESEIIDAQALLMIEYRADAEHHRRRGHPLPYPTIEYVRTLFEGKGSNPYSLFW